jgi:pyruvate formate lyase activating enzyme
MDYFLKYDDYTECTLCPHYCHIKPGKAGICSVRKNTGDGIELTTYGVISSVSLDPVEKKPLYHFFPGYNILSVGSYGCNMRCDFCQNWQISQKATDSFSKNTDPQKILNDALSIGKNIGVAFTYNEPVISFEFMRDVAIKAKENGLHTVMVSNGYVNSNPLIEITGFIDAFNIDLKAFNDDFYKRLTGARLEPVKESLKQISRSGKHLEVTTLIIPGKNDSRNEMEEESGWIAGELGPETPFHLSRYFPSYRRDDPATSRSSLKELYEIASRHLKYVYLGNTGSQEGQDTSCSVCGTLVTKRSGYSTRTLNLDKSGRCTNCGNLVYKMFVTPFRQVD